MSDQRPDEGEAILGFWTPKVGEVHSGCYATAAFSEGRWHNPEDDEDYYVEPSHWMPLPAPPKEKK